MTSLHPNLPSCRALAGLLLVLSVPLHVHGAESVAAPSPKRSAEILNMVKQDCGSCHGMTMKGGLGPALTREALSGVPTDILVATILQGRAGTAMPPWQRFVSADEAAWIVEQLKKGFPDAR